MYSQRGSRAQLTERPDERISTTSHSPRKEDEMCVGLYKQCIYDYIYIGGE